jgi:hypothetical protein
VLSNTIHARYAHEKTYSFTTTRVKVQMNGQLVLNGCVVTKKQGHTQWPYKSFQHETSSCINAIIIILS